MLFMQISREVIPWIFESLSKLNSTKWTTKFLFYILLLKKWFWSNKIARRLGVDTHSIDPLVPDHRQFLDLVMIPVEKNVTVIEITILFDHHLLHDKKLLSTKRL